MFPCLFGTHEVRIISELSLSHQCGPSKPTNSQPSRLSSAAGGLRLILQSQACSSPTAVPESPPPWY